MIKALRLKSSFQSQRSFILSVSPARRAGRVSGPYRHTVRALQYRRRE